MILTDNVQTLHADQYVPWLHHHNIADSSQGSMTSTFSQPTNQDKVEYRDIYPVIRSITPSPFVATPEIINASMGILPTIRLPPFTKELSLILEQPQSQQYQPFSNAYSTKSMLQPRFSFKELKPKKINIFKDQIIGLSFPNLIFPATSPKKTRSRFPSTEDKNKRPPFTHLHHSPSPTTYSSSQK